MTSVEEKIIEASDRHSNLLRILTDTDYANPTLQQQKKYVGGVEKDLQQLSSQIKALEGSREKELKEHESYRDSVMKRFAYKVGGKSDKFSQRAQKEEKEYFDALHEEHKAKELHAEMSRDLANAKSSQTELEGVVVRHDQAQKDLDALYNYIFEGPSPGFAEEDEQENATGQAWRMYQDTKSHAEACRQVVQALSQAMMRMQQAGMFLDQARQNSRMDMFGGGAMWDMMERNALSQAEMAMSQCAMAVSMAQRFSTDVPNLPYVNIEHGNLMSDVLFDNVFTDMAFHEKIKQAQAEHQSSASALSQILQNAKGRQSSANTDLRARASELQEARETLQRVRQQAFDRVAQPPQYQ